MEHHITDTTLYIPASKTSIPFCTRPHTKTRERPKARPNGEVIVKKVSNEEMDKLWIN